VVGLDRDDLAWLCALRLLLSVVYSVVFMLLYLYNTRCLLLLSVPSSAA
jgi:hypothetical protein